MFSVLWPKNTMIIQLGAGTQDISSAGPRQNSALDLYPSFDNDCLIQKLTALISLTVSVLMNSTATYPRVHI